MMKTLLICHHGTDLDQHGLTRWLASFSELVGVIVLRETPQGVWQRIRREIQRVGPVRFLDVTAFRVYYRVFLAKWDRDWERRQVTELARRYPGAASEYHLAWDGAERQLGIRLWTGGEPPKTIRVLECEEDRQSSERKTIRAICRASPQAYQ